MRPRVLAFLLPILILPVLVLADDQPPARVRESELSRSPLFVGSLKITVTAFNRGGPFSIQRDVEVQIENTSSAFTVFSPQRLSFVNRDYSQIDLLGIIPARGPLVPVADRRIAPGAHVKEIYALNGKVHLPARLYYDEKLLAVIAD